MQKNQNLNMLQLDFLQSLDSLHPETHSSFFTNYSDDDDDDNGIETDYSCSIDSTVLIDSDDSGMISESESELTDWTSYKPTYSCKTNAVNFLHIKEQQTQNKNKNTITTKINQMYGTNISANKMDYGTNNDTYEDGIIEDFDEKYPESHSFLRRSTIEGVLLLAPFIYVCYCKLNQILDPSDQQGQIFQKWFITCMTLMIIKRKKCSFPDLLYLLIFPFLLSTLTNLKSVPNSINNRLELNLLTSLHFLPLPSVLSSLLVFFNSSKSVYLLYSPIFHLSQKFINFSTSNSLSNIEISLFSLLLMNLLLNSTRQVMIIFIFLLFGSAISIVPSIPLINKIITITRTPLYKRLPDSDNTKLKYAYGVYLIFFISMMIISLGLLSLVLKQNSLVWLFNYMFLKDDSEIRLKITAIWLISLSILIPLINKVSVNWPLDFRRKIWHFTVFLLFIPFGIYKCREFVQLAMGIALVLFLLVEFIRVIALPPFGPIIHSELKKFVNERDTVGNIIVSHIFLLLGVSLPVYLYSDLTSFSAAPATGIICLGLGDSAASIIGRRYGKNKWPNSSKTIEGTLAFIVGSIVGFSIVWAFTGTFIFSAVLISAIATALLEATSSMNDNVIVPVYMYIIYRLVEGDF